MANQGEQSVAQIVSATSTQPGAQYRDGYGDFRFGRRFDQGFSYPGSLTAKTIIIPGHHNNNLAFKELGGFQRVGPFPYNELPLEIRQRILRTLLGPFYNYCDDRKESYIALKMSCAYATCEWKKCREDMISASLNYDPWDRNAADDIMLEIDEVDIKKPHPGRDIHPYLVNALPIMESNKGASNKGLVHNSSPDYSMLDLVCTLSHVNKHFREELAKVFWDKVHAHINCRRDLEGLENFLLDRPATIKGIQSLFLGIDCDESRSTFTRLLSQDKKMIRKLSEILDDVGTKLQLQDLHIILKLGFIKDENFAPGTDIDDPWAHGIRSLNVSRSFVLTVTGKYTAPWNTEKDRQSSKELKSNHNKHHAAMKNFLMPDSLRHLEPKGEVEKYLGFRAKSHADPVVEYPPKYYFPDNADTVMTHLIDGS